MKKKSDHLPSSSKNDTSESETSSIADFVNSVSHDIKNPLASIKAYAQVAKKRLQYTGDDKTFHCIDKIEKQSDRAIQLIAELLDTSRIAGGKIVIQKKPFRLDKLVRDTVEEVQITVNTHKIIEENKIKVKVAADKERIRRVLINLLTNAVKYSPEADKIIVYVSIDDQNAIVSIKDFGVGIPLTKQKHLFDPYFRVNEGDSRGYGLGLPIVKQIVEAHGGKVWFESRKGKGSIFYFSLPLT